MEFSYPVVTISLEDYDALSDADKHGYLPQYGKYKTTKYRNYEECDLGHTHFTGWATRETPIGDPVSYRKKTMMEITIDVMTAPLIDQANKSNVLMRRIMDGPSDKPIKVTWTKGGTK